MAIELVLGLIALALVLTVPGYFLTLAFFPSKKEIDSIERFTFSLVFSVTFLPLLLLAENQLLAIPVNYFSSLSTLLLLVLVGLIVWAIRTQRLPVPSKLYFLFPKVEKKDAVNFFFLKD